VDIHARKQGALHWLSDNPLATERDRNQKLRELKGVLAEEKAAHEEPNEFVCRNCKMPRPVEAMVSVMFAYVIRKDEIGIHRNHFEALDEQGRHRLWYLSMCEPCFDKLNLVEMPSQAASPQEEAK
jgi:hypothetical protein